MSLSTAIVDLGSMSLYNPEPFINDQNSEELIQKEI